jgi:RimJ/RimL family protein N-acetyltransferase
MIELEAWSQHDLPILEQNNSPDQTAHIGGPETREQLLRCHERYLGTAEAGRTRMFKILCDTLPAGSIGYWERRWCQRTVYETGWAVFRHFQGRGVAAGSTAALIAILRQEGRHRFLHAFPSPDNSPSNAICRKLGFELVGECDFEYPPGHVMRSNDWRFDLHRIRNEVEPQTR